ncbi:AraC family transcriptional regulator [Pseudomonas asplenii]|uniref:Transcriptional regulator, AraC family n=1 Tax=Pseudomonas asplenii TaxID=53407 RepID=A0A1H6P3V5_9PSED|nr:AraC family transcriptional regulator [Pseudomonas fuscovaginae]SEI24169.1 transcriptional regulator, AraC family [Pseudomonas fuscovaginae]
MGPFLTLRHYSDELIVHSHAHAQLVFGLSGRLDFEIEGRGSRVVEQSVAVVPYDAHHTCGSPDGSRCLVLDVPDEHWLVQSLGEHADASRRLIDRAGPLTLNASQGRLVDWLANSPVDDPLIARQGAVLLLASLNTPASTVSVGKRLPMAALDAHIDRYAARPLQVADLARVAGLSNARLHVRFLAECGRTPMDYLRHRRLRLALSLLRESGLPVGEIALRVGYSSQSAFCAAILREFGASPTALRREPGDN